MLPRNIAVPMLGQKHIPYGDCPGADCDNTALCQLTVAAHEEKTEHCVVSDKFYQTKQRFTVSVPMQYSADVCPDSVVRTAMCRKGGLVAVQSIGDGTVYDVAHIMVNQCVHVKSNGIIPDNCKVSDFRQVINKNGIGLIKMTYIVESGTGATAYRRIVVTGHKGVDNLEINIPVDGDIQVEAAITDTGGKCYIVVVNTDLSTLVSYQTHIIDNGIWQQDIALSGIVSSADYNSFDKVTISEYGVIHGLIKKEITAENLDDIDDSCSSTGEFRREYSLGTKTTYNYIQVRINNAGYTVETTSKGTIGCIVNNGGYELIRCINDNSRTNYSLVNYYQVQSSGDNSYLLTGQVDNTAGYTAHISLDMGGALSTDYTGSIYRCNYKFDLHSYILDSQWVTDKDISVENYISSTGAVATSVIMGVVIQRCTDQFTATTGHGRLYTRISGSTGIGCGNINSHDCAAAKNEVPQHDFKTETMDIDDFKTIYPALPTPESAVSIANGFAISNKQDGTEYRGVLYQIDGAENIWKIYDRTLNDITNIIFACEQIHDWAFTNLMYME